MAPVQPATVMAMFLPGAASAVVSQHRANDRFARRIASINVPDDVEGGSGIVVRRPFAAGLDLADPGHVLLVAYLPDCLHNHR
jgi:hypothetical protein